METTEKVYAMGEWELMLATRDTGEQTQIDVEIFDYFLDVLPPVFMNKKFTFSDGQTVNASFGFAEGWEPITVFWREDGKYFCRRSKMINPEA